MSPRSQRLRALVTERLTAAAEEIFALVERTIAEYEEELSRCKEHQLQGETRRRQPPLEEAPGPRSLLPVLAAPGDSEVLEKQFTIKSEPEELSIQPCRPEFPFTVCVKNDSEESSALREELISVGNENSDDWTEPWEPSVGGSAPQSEAEDHEDERRTNEDVMNVCEVSVTPEDPDPPLENCSVALPAVPEGDKASMTLMVPKVRRHRCPICGKSFKRDLWSHMLVHTGERPFSCSVCHKGFTRKSSLSLHMKLHLSEKPFRCGVCQKEFTQKSNFTIHMERHAKAAESKIQQLQRKRNRKKARKMSMASEEMDLSWDNDEPDSEPVPEHSGLQSRKKRQCRELYEARSLYVSTQSALGDRSEECPICGKRFHDLWPHMRLHTGERPFRCSVCRKGFPRRSSLTLHKRLHMQEKPFKCHICDKGFTQNNNFKRHMAKHGKEGDLLQPGPSQEELALSGVYQQKYFHLGMGHDFEPQAGSSAQ